MKTLPLAGSLMCGVWLALYPGQVHAYTISTPLTDGCHESITTHALRTVRIDLATAAPFAANENEQALIDDLQFTPAGDMNDLGGTTLLLAVRDNDLKGRSSQDLTELAEVHGDPGAQHEHCLRAGNQDEPDGSAAAVNRCRAFVHGRVLEALAGLDASGKPDLGKRTTLGVYLALRHHVDAPLPTYYVRMGQAIHAIQDSFTMAGATRRSVSTKMRLRAAARLLERAAAAGRCCRSWRSQDSASRDVGGATRSCHGRRAQRWHWR